MTEKYDGDERSAQDQKIEKFLELNRRNLLKGSAASVLGLPLLSGQVGGQTTKNSPQTNESTTLLGSFEESTDGWRTNGGNKLGRASADSFAGKAFEGKYALAVVTQGDGYPMIENKKLLRSIDLVEQPYLGLSVRPAIEDSNSNVTFQMRLHYNPDSVNLKDQKGNNRKNGKGGTVGRPLVVESPKMTVSQYTLSRLTWDLTDVDRNARQNAKRFEINWYPTEFPPSGGARGNQQTYEYTGYTLFDDIHVSDDPTNISRERLRTLSRELKLSHGSLVKRNTDVEAKGLEVGQFEFSDGTFIDYKVERIAENKYLYTLAGEDFKLGGGW